MILIIMRSMGCMVVITIILLSMCRFVSVEAKSTADSIDTDGRWELTLEKMDVTEERNEDTKETKRVSDKEALIAHKRYYPSEGDKTILQTCFSGDLYQTAKALGVFNIPGVSMVNVSGELYKALLLNNTIKMKKTGFEAFQGEFTTLSSAERYQKRRIPEKPLSISKRGTDICEEDEGVLIELAHASGQLAYVLTDVDCVGAICSFSGINIGSCVKKVQTILVYIIDGSGNFVPSTVEIGCGCECMLS